MAREPFRPRAVRIDSMVVEAEVPALTEQTGELLERSVKERGSWPPSPGAARSGVARERSTAQRRG